MPTFASSFDRIPPSSIEEEQVVIGSVLVDPGLMDAVGAIVRSSDFHHPFHETAFAGLVALQSHGSPIDKVSLATELRERNMLDKVGGLAYLNGLMDTVQTTASAEYHARRVRELSVLRQMIRLGLDIATLGYEREGDVGGALADLSGLVRQLQDRALVVDPAWVGQSAAEMTEAGAPAAEFEFEGILGRDDGPAAFVAPPGVGKSWVAIHALDCAVSGRPLFGRYRVPKPRSSGIYLNFDAGRKAFARRIVNVVRCDHPGIRIVSPPNGWNAQDFERLMRTNRGAFVVIDCLSDIYHPDPALEMGDAARDFWRWLRRVYEENDANGLIIDHTNRAGGIYGSIQKIASARTMIVAEAVNDGPPTPGQLRLRLTNPKLNEAEAFSPLDVLLDFLPDGLTFTVAGGPLSVETSKMRLFAKIEAEGPVTRTQVGADNGNSKRGTKADWRSLVDEAAIVQTGTKIGKAPLWWTPEKIRERVLMGSALYPADNATHARTA